MFFRLFFQIVLFTVNFCKKNFLHKSLVQILTPDPIWFILKNIYLGLPPPPEKKKNGSRSINKLTDYS